MFELAKETNALEYKGELYKDQATVLRRQVDEKLRSLLNRQFTYMRSDQPGTITEHRIEVDAILENADALIEILQHYKKALQEAKAERALA